MLGLAHLGQGFQRHVTTLQHQLIILLKQEFANQTVEGRLVGEDADDCPARAVSYWQDIYIATSKLRRT